MAKKRRRGRPPTYLPSDRRYLAKLIRKYGIAGAQRQAPFSICDSTLIKIARDFGIVLPKGRRPRTAA
jgi:hypothetical protein